VDHTQAIWLYGGYSTDFSAHTVLSAGAWLCWERVFSRLSIHTGCTKCISRCYREVCHVLGAAAKHGLQLTLCAPLCWASSCSVILIRAPQALCGCVYAGPSCSCWWMTPAAHHCLWAQCWTQASESTACSSGMDVISARWPCGSVCRCCYHCSLGC
jgi:hypothetical protein